MKKTLLFNGREITFTQINMVVDGESMAGLLMHDESDEFRDGDCVSSVFGNTLPEDEDDVECYLEDSSWASWFVKGEYGIYYLET